MNGVDYDKDFEYSKYDDLLFAKSTKFYGLSLGSDCNTLAYYIANGQITITFTVKITSFL
jgi:hypothetical protein